MNARERFHQTMRYGERDRAPFHEFFWPTWPETVERWTREGGYETRQDGFRLRPLGFRVPVVLSEPALRAPRSRRGRQVHHLRGPPRHRDARAQANPLSSMPQFIRFPWKPARTSASSGKRGCARTCARASGRMARAVAPAAESGLRLHRLADRWGGFFGSLRTWWESRTVHAVLRRPASWRR